LSDAKDLEPHELAGAELYTAPERSVGGDQRLVRWERRERAAQEAVAPSLAELAPIERFAPLVDKAEAFIDASRARSTRAKYAEEWARFERYGARAWA
jgi:hypothetical protein